MNIAVRAGKNSQDTFWLAVVQSVKTDEPLVYNLRYYQYNKTQKIWKLMKGQSAYGWVPHSAILAAGIEFNQDMSMKVSSQRLITAAINSD